MFTGQEYEDAIVKTGMVMTSLFIETMWRNGIEESTIKKIADEVGAVLNKDAERYAMLIGPPNPEGQTG